MSVLGYQFNISTLFPTQISKMERVQIEAMSQSWDTPGIHVLWLWGIYRGCPVHDTRMQKWDPILMLPTGQTILYISLVHKGTGIKYDMSWMAKAEETLKVTLQNEWHYDRRRISDCLTSKNSPNSSFTWIDHITNGFMVPLTFKYMKSFNHILATGLCHLYRLFKPHGTLKWLGLFSML